MRIVTTRWPTGPTYEVDVESLAGQGEPTEFGSARSEAAIREDGHMVDSILRAGRGRGQLNKEQPAQPDLLTACCRNRDAMRVSVGVTSQSSSRLGRRFSQSPRYCV